MYNLTYTVYINISGAQYDKIAVDVEKTSIYKTDINVRGAIQKFVDKLNIFFIYYQI